MTVKIILATKGHEVLTIEPTSELGVAAALMADRRIGALIVTGADHRIVGIVSERDIVRALAEHGADAVRLPLSQVMTRKVETCIEADTVSSLMELMTDGKFRHVPVVEHGRLVGLVSIGDVVKHRLGEMEHEQAALRDYIQSA